MFMWNLYALVAVTLTPLFVFSQVLRIRSEPLHYLPQYKPYVPEDKPTRYCGDKLHAILQKVCHRYYYSPYPEYLDIHNPVDEDLTDSWLKNTNFHELNEKIRAQLNRYERSLPGSREKIRAQLNRYKRSKPGIVDECCKQPCTHKTLRTYCMETDSTDN